MKKISALLILSFSLSLINIKADEGMFLIHLIGEKTYADMVKRGLKLSKDQLYSINKNSINHTQSDKKCPEGKVLNPLTN